MNKDDWDQRLTFLLNRDIMLQEFLKCKIFDEFYNKIEIAFKILFKEQQNLPEPLYDNFKAELNGLIAKYRMIVKYENKI